MEKEGCRPLILRQIMAEKMQRISTEYLSGLKPRSSNISFYKSIKRQFRLLKNPICFITGNAGALLRGFP